MLRPTLHVVALTLVLVSGEAATYSAPPDDSTTTLYRDEFGIPHVYAPTLEAASYAIGYAQAEDRLEELLKNYRRAAGTMAEASAPSSMPTTWPSASGVTRRSAGPAIERSARSCGRSSSLTSRA